MHLSNKVSNKKASTEGAYYAEVDPVSVHLRRQNQIANHHMPISPGISAYCYLMRIFLLAIMFLLPSALVLAAGKWNDPHDYYKSATRSSGDLLRNVEKFHLPQGLAKMNKKKYDRALEDFDFVLRYYPNHPKGLLFMSEVSRRMKKPEIAEKYFQKAFKMYPGYANTHSIYGIFLQKTDRMERAIEQYRKSLKLKPNASETHYNLGLALYKTGKQDGALLHAQKAYKLGYPLPGLRNKLVKAGIWKKNKPAKTKPDNVEEPSAGKEPSADKEPSAGKEPSAITPE
ncbi:MAG: tetratricopeptide repeat protein [Ectothiorhodospiraceae bacterium]|nr:tetratricopeptide repeat protein [Ectothiorhodospiraceae bacterium]